MTIGLPALGHTRTPSTCGRRDWNCCLGAILTDYASSAFHRSESLAGGTEKGPLRLCGGRVQDHPSSGKNQGELRTNQPQPTPAQDDGRKRKFRVPRFVAGNQPVSSKLAMINRTPHVWSARPDLGRWLVACTFHLDFFGFLSCRVALGGTLDLNFWAFNSSCCRGLDVWAEWKEGRLDGYVG